MFGKKIILLSLLSLSLVGVPVMAKTTTVPVKKAAMTVVKKTTKKVVKSVKKVVVKKRIKKVAVKSAARSSFSVSIAAVVKSATGNRPPAGYMEALQKAETDCVRARTAAQKQNCDDEEKVAAAMVDHSVVIAPSATASNSALVGNDQE